MKKRKTKTEIQVRVLQNGHPIVECVKTIRRNLWIDITANYTGDLAIPLYPLASDIHLFHIDKGQLYLNLDQPWSGFVTSDGAVEELREAERGARLIPIGLDDYGTFSVRDIRVMFQVRYKHSEKRVATKKIKGYSTNIFSQLFPTKSEIKSVVGATAAASVVMGSLLWGLLSVDQRRPTHFEELDNLYTLPFLSRDHLRFAPEALQGNLDRTNVVASSIRYFRSFTNMLMGQKIGVDKKLLYKPSRNHYNELYRQQRETLEARKEKQTERNNKRFDDPTKATFFIPSVSGESFQFKLESLITKIKTTHTSFDIQYKNRLKISKAFSQDEIYDWVNYHKTGNNRSFAADFLSKIRVFKGLTNEENMYAVANNLAVQAQNIQKHLERNAKPPVAYAAKVVFIPSNVTFASFTNSSQLLSNDEKLGQIRASSFDVKRRETIKEPLIGKINPNLISNAVKKKQFELQLCYDLALRRNQATRGEMAWQWRIDSRGRISDIILTNSNIRDRKMVECIRRKMAIWRFPRPKRGSVEVNHRFFFSPQKG